MFAVRRVTLDVGQAVTVEFGGPFIAHRTNEVGYEICHPELLVFFFFPFSFTRLTGRVRLPGVFSPKKNLLGS